jgi:hypothetical protein
MQEYRIGILKGKHQRRALAIFRADRAKDAGRFRPLILRGRAVKLT